MNRHPDIEQLISVMLDGEASPEEVTQIQEHLKGCSSCSKYYQELSKLSSSLKSWDDEDLSPDLEHMIKQKISKAKESDTMKDKNQLLTATIAGSVVVSLLVLVVSNQMMKQYQLAKNSAPREIIKYIQPQDKLRLAKSMRTEILKEENRKVSEHRALSTVNGQKEAPALLAKVETKGYGFKSSVGGTLERSDEDSKIQYNQPIGGGAVADLKTKQKRERDRLEIARKSNGMNAQVAPQPAQTGYLLNENAARLQDKILRHPYTPSDTPESESVSFDEGIASSVMIVDGERYDDIQPYGIKGQYEIAQTEIYEIQGREEYDYSEEEPFSNVLYQPLSTFSVDVDTASYSNIRRYLNNHQMPPANSIRIEEMINYFVYDYPQPKGKEPFSITTEVAACPWNQNHSLAMIGIQGKEFQGQQTPPSNLVFLIDVSGSMNQPNKLPLLKQAFHLMVNQLKKNERIAIVTYAGSAGLVLDSTPGSEKNMIRNAIDRLYPGGSTAGAQGIELAYRIASSNFIEGGNNRVILATDGDFNVGVSEDNALVRLIEKERKKGIVLTVLGFGTGNYKDAKMQKLADNGNGNYYYIDNLKEAKKVLVNELGSTLFTIAKDVKLQIEFNPQFVKSYRLVGYETRKLREQDFRDDRKDAGDIGAGHTVTALYEIIPTHMEEDIGDPVPLNYQKTDIVPSNDLMTIKLRYKDPEGHKSRLTTKTIGNEEYFFKKGPTRNFQFASAVAEFGLLLKNSPYKGHANYHNVLSRARQSKGNDPWGYRSEFISLVEKASRMQVHHIYQSPSPDHILYKGQSTGGYHRD